VELYIIQAMIGALMFGFGGILFKWNAHNHGDEAYFFISLYGVGAVCFFLGSLDVLSEFSSAEYLFMALIVALGSAGGNFAFSQGMRYGPAGLTSAFAKANIVIVILISSFYYGESITWMEGVGILFFFAAMLVVNIKLGGHEKSTSGAWFLIMVACIILLAFRNGGLKIANEAGLSGVLIVAVSYAICAIVSCLVLLKNKKKVWTAKVPKWKILTAGALTGTVSYGGLYFYITALKSGPGSVVVTIFSLDMFFILLMSYAFFGERLNRNQKVGFLLSAIGLTLIGLK
jgi:drug/metabolite transporter (DMT)-like permease